MSSEFDFNSIKEKYGICSLTLNRQRCECLKKHYHEMISCANWNAPNINNYAELAEWQKQTFKKD